MDSPTSQSVANYLSNHMGFQSWLAQHANQNIASFRNDPQLNQFREEYNQNLNLGKLRTDPAQNTNIDQNTFMQGVELAKGLGNMDKQAQQSSNLEQLLSNVNRSLITAQNSLVDLVELINQGFTGGGGVPVETNVPMSQDEGATGQVEHLKQVASEILPHVEQAAQIFQSEMKYFSSFADVQSGGVVAIKKASITTKYITGIKSLQDAHDKVEQVYQFADNFPYFVLSYKGFQALCNFKTACNNVKKDIENLQKI